ncbi:MAG: PQQ-binding-like beta-propeller repeat protein [Nitrososphaerales archaeon]
MRRLARQILMLSLSWLLVVAFHNGVSEGQEIQGNDLGLNWDQPAYDIRNTGFNPQQEITKDNIGTLELKWIYQAPERPPTVPGARVTFGIHAPPIVVNGILYFVTESSRLTALNTLNGRELWSFQYDLAELVLADQWSFLQTENAISLHDDKIWLQTNDCKILGFEPFGGEILEQVVDTCVEIPGNDGTYVGHYSPTFFETIMITRASAGGGGGRGYVAGYDSINQRLLWRWFVVPPTGGDPNWDFAEASKGNIEPFAGDWGNNDLIGGGSVFSLIAVDEETGIIYFPTGAPALSYDASLRPGPNLFSSSIVALDAETGELIWYHQTTPHDINGHAPTTSIILADAEVRGEERRVVMTASRADYAYILDASNGELLHDPISIGAQKINVFNTNRGNQADLTLSQNGLVDEIYCPGQIGGSASVSAFAYNTLFIASQNFCSTLSEVRIFYKDQLINGYIASPAPIAQDSMISAIDVSTGNLKWRFPLENRYQGGITVSGGVVYLVDLAGDFYALDADTGEVLRMIPMNGNGNTAVTIAADAQGKMTLYVATGGRKSGVITAFGLPEMSSSTEQNNNLLIIGGVALALIVVSAYVVALRAYNRKGR